MKKTYLIIISFTLMLFSLASFINSRDRKAYDGGVDDDGI